MRNVVCCIMLDSSWFTLRSEHRSYLDLSASSTIDGCRAGDQRNGVRTFIYRLRLALVRSPVYLPSSFTRQASWQSCSPRRWNKLIRVRWTEFDRLGLEFWKK